MPGFGFCQERPRQPASVSECNLIPRVFDSCCYPFTPFLLRSSCFALVCLLESVASHSIAV